MAENYLKPNKNVEKIDADEISIDPKVIERITAEIINNPQGRVKDWDLDYWKIG